MKSLLDKAAPSPSRCWRTDPNILITVLATLALIVTTVFVLPPGAAHALTPGYEITTTYAAGSGDASTTYTNINATVEQPSLGDMTGPASAFSTGGIVGSNNSITSVWSANGTATFTFNPPVDNPILHLDRLGGYRTTAGFPASTDSNTSVWTLNGPAGATLNRLSGTPHFEVVGAQIFRTPNVATAENSSCATSSASGTGCGSVQITGSAISTLTFGITFDGPFLNGDPLDGVSLRIEVPIPEPQLTLVKTVTNDETVPGTAGPADFTLTADDNAGNAISGLSGTPAVTNAQLPAGTYTLSETGVSGYTQSITCSGATLSGTELVLNTGDNATCTFVNNDADGDGDGVADSVDDEPANPCVPVPYAAGTQPAAGTDGDCDGDGAANADDSDPGDPCATPGDPGWVELSTNDCDGDGTTVGDGDTADTNPCVPDPYAAGTQPAAGTDGDCDGDGEPNASDDEPANPCVPVPYAAGAQPAAGTDGDCDGDGAANADDSDPGDPCATPGDPGWVELSTNDCDGDGTTVGGGDSNDADSCVDAADPGPSSNDCDGDGTTVGDGDQDDTDVCVDASGRIDSCSDSDGDGITDDVDSDPLDPCAPQGDAAWTQQGTNDCDGDGTTVGDGDQDDTDVCVDAIGSACFRIDGRVWFDEDREADQDSGEVDLSGIRLVLIDTASGQAIDEAFTASPYEFNDVPRGTYRVELDASTLPAGVGITFEEDGSRNESLTVSIVNNDVLSQDFGYATTQVCGQLLSGSTPAPSGTALSVVDSAGNSFDTTAGAGGQYCVEGTLDNPLIAGTASVSASFGGSLVTETVSLVAGTSVVRDLVVTPVAAVIPAPTATPLPTPTATPLPTPTAVPLSTPTAVTPAPAPRASLAFTGSSSGTLLLVGGLFLASGAAFVALGARRRSAAVETD